MDNSLKLEDYLEKYQGRFGLVDVAVDYKIPEEISFMRKYVNNQEIMKWLSSLLVNGKNKQTIFSNLQIMIGDGEEHKEEDVIRCLRDIWIIECLN